MKKIALFSLFFIGIHPHALQAPEPSTNAYFLGSDRIFASMAVIAGASAYYYHTYNAQETLIFPENSRIKHIIFDLDGVLLGTNITNTLLSLGISSLIGYMLATGHMPSKQDLFQAFYPIPAINESFSEHEGKPMPGILVDWQKGSRSHEDLLQICQHYFQEQYSQGKLSWYEADIFMKLSYLMFDCKAYIASKRLISSSILVLKALSEYAQKNNIKLYILSNWDKESLDLAQEKFPELFTFFAQENIIISGKIGLLKPDPNIFSYVLERYDIDPEECLFIDDEAINITHAQSLRIHTIHCTSQVHNHLLQQILNVF